MDDEPPTPSRSTLVNWMRANLAMTAFVCGGLSTAGVALWQGGGWVTEQRGQLERVDAVDAGLRHAADNTHDALVDVDRRLNEVTIARADGRRQIEAEMNGLAQRIIILETQLKFVGDRVQQQQQGSRR